MEVGIAMPVPTVDPFKGPMNSYIKRQKYLKRELTWPPGTTFIVVNGSKVRHVAGDAGEPPTWCNMVWPHQAMADYDVAVHGDLKVCGSCARTTRARKATAS